ncbi:MAG TPA: hypothetical protein VL400_25440 [Polyangiaceae bacterium]|jgi:hypothetical protein|nr:hypothetical protein [Polyangiaceae bacterium]
MRQLFSRALVTSVALAALAAPLASPGVAHAEHEIRTPFTGTRPFQLDIHGGLSWYGLGLATGVRFGIPIMHNGFIDSIDNAVYVNFGFELYYADEGWDPATRHYYVGFGIPVMLHWEFYFNDTWSAFAELGFQVYFPPAFLDGGSGHSNYYVEAGGWVIAMVGGTLHFNEVFGLTLRVGNPYVVVGLTFQF